MTPFLTASELDELTAPLRQAGARRRYLERLGVPYSLRPDGQPLVGREALARRLGASPTPAANDAAGPNAAALMALIGGRGRR